VLPWSIVSRTVSPGLGYTFGYTLPVTAAAPARLAAMPTRPEPAARSSTLAQRWSRRRCDGCFKRVCRLSY
jgi:hypothetical protein